MTTAAEAQSPLSTVLEAFKELAKRLKSINDGHGGGELRLDKFCEACSLVSVLFRCLGLAFKFPESEHVAKPSEFAKLCGRSYRYGKHPDAVGVFKSFEMYAILWKHQKDISLEKVLDLDVANGTVRTAGSHLRNLRSVRQGLDPIRALFEHFVSTDDCSLKDVATTAYSQVCVPFHTWAVRTAVHAGMYTLPSRDQLLTKLNETDQSADKKMRRYINAALPVIEYMDKLYISRNVSLDW